LEKILVKSYKIKESVFPELEKDADKEGRPVNKHVGIIIEQYLKNKKDGEYDDAK